MIYNKARIGGGWMKLSEFLLRFNTSNHNPNKNVDLTFHSSSYCKEIFLNNKIYLKKVHLKVMNGKAFI